jgi:hypothetical protein
VARTPFAASVRRTPGPAPVASRISCAVAGRSAAKRFVELGRRETPREIPEDRTPRPAALGRRGPDPSALLERPNDLAAGTRALREIGQPDELAARQRLEERALLLGRAVGTERSLFGQAIAERTRRRKPRRERASKDFALPGEETLRHLRRGLDELGRADRLVVENLEKVAQRRLRFRRVGGRRNDDARQHALAEGHPDAHPGQRRFEVVGNPIGEVAPQRERQRDRDGSHAGTVPKTCGDRPCGPAPASLFHVRVAGSGSSSSSPSRTNT